MNALGVSFCTTVVSSDLVLDIVNIVFYLFVCRCDSFDGFRNIVCNDDMFFHSVCDRVKFILRIVLTWAQFSYTYYSVFHKIVDVFVVFLYSLFCWTSICHSIISVCLERAALTMISMSDRFSIPHPAFPDRVV